MGTFRMDEGGSIGAIAAQHLHALVLERFDRLGLVVDREGDRVHAFAAAIECAPHWSLGAKRRHQPKRRAHLDITAELDLVSGTDAEDWRDRLQLIVNREIDALHRPVVRAAVITN